MHDMCGVQYLGLCSLSQVVGLPMSAFAGKADIVI